MSATGSLAAEHATQREAKLRRVAILLSSLPNPLAAKLLGTIDPSSKQQLRRTMAALSDVDPMERQRVVEAFRVSIGQAADQNNPTNRFGEDTFESSHRDVSASAPAVIKNAFPDSASASDPQNASVEQTPLAFLGDVPDGDLADLMKDEHPQAVALVLASVAPQKAGRVLALLPDQLRSQSLSRIGRLGEIPMDAAADLASHFQSRLRKASLSGALNAQSTATGKRKLDAILASMQPQTVAPPHPPETHLVVHPPHASAGPPPSNMPSQSTAEQSAIDLSHRLRVIRDDDGPETNHVAPNPSTTLPQNDRATTHPVAPVNPVPAGRPAAKSLDSTDAIHTRLVSLTPIELCKSLGRVDTRQAMLCLCGLPNHVAESALAVLPKNQAKTVRMQMSQLNSLNLRDIDEAKERVAQASLQIAPLPSDQPVPSGQPAGSLAAA